MVIDHVCIIFYPDQQYWMRFFGQITFPLVCYLLIQGHIYTSNHQKYLIAIFITAVLSQPFFSLLFPYTHLNDLFTLFFALLLILLYEKFNLIFVFLLIFPLIYFQVVSIYILLIFIFYFNRNNKFNLLFYSSFFYIFIYLLTHKFFVLGSMLFMIFLFKPLPRFNINKYFFYCFYPIHFFLIYLIHGITA